MVQYILKNTGKLIGFLLLIFSTTVLHAETLKTVLDSSEISLGDYIRLRVYVRAESSSISINKMPRVDGLHIQQSGVQSSFISINGKISRESIILFTVIPERRGTFTIPAIVLSVNGQRKVSEPKRLNVVKRAASRVQGGGVIQTLTEVSGKRFFAGEPVILRYFILASPSLRFRVHGYEGQPKVQGFFIKEVEESFPEESVSIKNKTMVKRHVQTFLLIPADTGKLKIDSGSIIVSVLDSGFFQMMSQKKWVYTDEKDITITPVPSKGAPAEFKGDVGSFNLTAQFDTSDIPVFEERRLKVRLKGEGNLITTSIPQFSKAPASIKVVPAEGESSLSLESGKLSGEKEFVFSIIPEKEGKLNLGSCSFTFFNPDTKTFKTVKTEPLSFTVLPGAPQSPQEKVAPPGSGTSSMIIIYIVAALGAVGLITGGVIFWEKKRQRELAVPEETNSKGKIIPVTPSAIKKEELYLYELARAIHENDTESFVNHAQKSVNSLGKLSNLKVDESSTLERIKEHLYAIRYGGSTIDEESMKEILASLKNLSSGAVN